MGSLLSILSNQKVRVRWLVCLLATVLVPQNTIAGESFGYQVEFLIFRNLKGESHTEHRSRYAILEQTHHKLNPSKKIVKNLRFQAEITGQLEPVRHKLAASHRYQVLFHGHWNQTPGTDNDKTARLDLTSVDGRSLLSGSFKLHIDQLLFLETTIVLHNSPTTPLSGVSNMPHLLKETRRLRLREIHYLDHPEFGLVLTIRRHPASE